MQGGFCDLFLHVLYCRNNTAYTYTNSTTQIKDGIYGALTGNSSKIINTNVGAASKPTVLL